MTLEESVLRDDALRATPGGFELAVGLAWYRSLPLSCLESLDISLDGRDVPLDGAHLRLNGTDHDLGSLAALDDEWWFVQDAATVVVPIAERPSRGETTTVEVRLATRIPYIIIGPETALVQRTTVEREVTAR